MFGKNKYVIIELDNERLKMVHFSSRAGARHAVPLHLAVKDIIDFKEEQIAESITGFLAEWNAKTDKIYVSVSRQQITTRNLKLPSSNNKEIMEMVDLQLSKLTPYSREEIVTSTRIIEVEDGYSKILLLIIHRDIINRLLRIMEFGAVRPEEFYFSSEGVSLNVMSFPRKWESMPIGIIDIDHKWSDFVVVKENTLRKSQLLFVRNINIGRTHLDQIEGDYKNKFIEEVKRLFDVYASSDIDGEIKKIVLCGASADLTDVAALIKQNFNIDVDVGAGSPRPPAIPKSVSFSSLMGLGFNLPLIKTNLTPAEITMERRLISRGKEIMSMGALLFFIVILGMAVFFEKLYFRKKNLQDILEQYKTRESEVSVIEKKSAKVNLIRERINSKLSVLNIISEIYGRTPDNLYFSAINFDSRKGIVLRGYSEDPANIFAFVNQMEDSPYFNQVKTTYMTKRKAADIDLTDFELAGLLE